MFKERVQYHLNAPPCVCSENGNSVLRSWTGETRFLVTDLKPHTIYPNSEGKDEVKYPTKIFVKMNSKLQKCFANVKSPQ